MFPAPKVKGFRRSTPAADPEFDPSRVIAPNAWSAITRTPGSCVLPRQEMVFGASYGPRHLTPGYPVADTLIFTPCLRGRPR